jgi:transmembrane sensor
MNSQESKINADGSCGAKPVSAPARAEAAAWIARLHGPNRTPEVEAGFRRWLAEDPERARAFELLTDTWEKSARLRRRPLEEVVSWERPGFRMSFSRAAIATAAVAVLAVLGTVLFLQRAGVTTGVGEQRTLALDDGSRVYLNTDTRAIVQYDDDVRLIELKRGEALFEVAKRADWPFVVIAGDKQVRALGTSFVVRRDDDTVAVTLVEGKVTVEDLADSSEPADRKLREQAQGSASDDSSDRVRRRARTLKEEVLLSPGERLTLTGTSDPKIDQPAIDKVTAWQRGQVALDHTPLADAVAEMNRYSRVRLVIEDAAVAAIPVSGIFRAGDSGDFARAVARTYGLGVMDSGAVITLTSSSNRSALERPDRSERSR